VFYLNTFKLLCGTQKSINANIQRSVCCVWSYQILCDNIEGDAKDQNKFDHLM
jgi:hypothetical protein